jgi:iron complex transport system substrate-binding protein
MLDLEASHLLAGVTTYSPPLPHEVEIVGNLTNPNVEKIILLKPDAVLYSVEDAAVQRTEQLTALGIKQFSFRRNTDYKTICDNYRSLARIIGKEELAEKKLTAYNRKLEEIKNRSHNRARPSVAFFVSLEPLITVSRLSFISGIIDDAGGMNVYHDLEKAYPLVSAESLIILKPEIILSMMPDGENFFTRLLSGYSMKKNDLSGKVYSINPDNIALYTPANYVNSVDEISDKIDLYLKRARGKQ